MKQQITIEEIIKKASDPKNMNLKQKEQHYFFILGISENLFKRAMYWRYAANEFKEKYINNDI